jgi:hypothetical protein
MQNRLLQAIILAAGVFVHVLIAGAIAAATPRLNKIPYHTSMLTGEGWVLELLNGHPRRIQTELGVRRYVFRRLVSALQDAGLGRSRFISLEEKLAILYFCMHRLQGCQSDTLVNDSSVLTILFPCEHSHRDLYAHIHC